jgi:hypothetical protein
MKTDAYKLKVILDTPLLGSQPTRDVASEFIAKKNGFGALPEDEIELLPDALERGTTVFHRLADGSPCLMNYHLLGFLKEAGKVQNGKVTGGVKALRSKVSQGIFISPRFLPVYIPAGKGIDYLERPLRAETALGPRVALARSEMLPEGTWFTCMLEVLAGEITEEVLRDLLDYGWYRGLGQWRNSGAYGTFRYELVKE